MGVYEAEVRFYQEVAPTADIAVTRCHSAAFEPATGWFTLVFDDLSTTAEVAGVVHQYADLGLDLAVSEITTGEVG